VILWDACVRKPTTQPIDRGCFQHAKPIDEVPFAIHSALPPPFDSIHEASHVVLGAYVGAIDIQVILHFGQPRCHFSHFLAMPGLITSHARCAGDRTLSKLSESDCAARSTSDRGIRQKILEKMANPAREGSVCADAERKAFQLVERLRDEIYEVAASIQRHVGLAAAFPPTSSSSWNAWCGFVP
jgi:hypothetical protein